MRIFDSLILYEDRLKYLMDLNFYGLFIIIRDDEILLKFNQLYHPCLLKLANMYGHGLYLRDFTSSKINFTSSKIIGDALEYSKTEIIKHLNKL